MARAGTVELKRLEANRYDPALLSEPVYSAGRYNRAEATKGETVRPGPAGGVESARGRGGARTVSAVKAGQVCVTRPDESARAPCRLVLLLFL